MWPVTCGAAERLSYSAVDDAEVALSSTSVQNLMQLFEVTSRSF